MYYGNVYENKQMDLQEEFLSLLPTNFLPVGCEKSASPSLYHVETYNHLSLKNNSWNSGVFAADRETTWDANSQVSWGIQPMSPDFCPVDWALGDSECSSVLWEALLTSFNSRSWYSPVYPNLWQVVGQLLDLHFHIEMVNLSGWWNSESPQTNFWECL